jgi:hypothetical protein
MHYSVLRTMSIHENIMYHYIHVRALLKEERRSHMHIYSYA